MLEKLCKKEFFFQNIKNKILALEIDKCTNVQGSHYWGISYL